MPSPTPTYLPTWTATPTATRPQPARTPTPTDTPIPTRAPTPTPTPPPGDIQTKGEGVIITLKPGHPGSLSADGKSQTDLSIDINPDAACWGGSLDVAAGSFYVTVYSSLGSVSPPDISPDSFPVKVTLTAGTTSGQAGITVEVSYCPPGGVMVFGVCSDPDSVDRRCVGEAIITIH